MLVWLFIHLMYIVEFQIALIVFSVGIRVPDIQPRRAAHHRAIGLPTVDKQTKASICSSSHRQG